MYADSLTTDSHFQITFVHVNGPFCTTDRLSLLIFCASRREAQNFDSFSRVLLTREPHLHTQGVHKNCKRRSYFLSCIIFPIQCRNVDFVYFEVSSCLKTGDVGVVFDLNVVSLEVIVSQVTETLDTLCLTN